MLLLQCQPYPLKPENSHWDVDKLHEVSNEAHDSKTDGNCLTDLDVLCTTLVRPIVHVVPRTCLGRLSTPVDKLMISPQLVGVRAQIDLPAFLP